MINKQMTQPLVSVILPSYNRGHLLARAVKTVLEQSFQDWELLIIDDGSTDQTESIVKAFCHDPRILYFKLEKNTGLCNARNTGIERSQGKFIAFLDSDDEWLSLKLEKQIEVFNKSDCKPHVGLVYTGAYFIDSVTGEKRIRLAKERGHIPNMVITNNPIGGPSRVMVLKESLDRVGYFDNDFLALEDWELWSRISEKYSIDVAEEPLVNYYEGYSDSISVNTDKLIQGYQSFWRKYNIYPEKKNIIATHCSKLGHRLCYYGDFKRGRSYLKKAFFQGKLSLVPVVLYILSLLGNRAYKYFTFLFLKVNQ